MAVNPQDLAEEQTQRAAIDAQGAPTDFATDPKLATQVAGGGLKSLLEIISNVNNIPTNNTDLPPAPKTPQERVLIDDENYSADAARKEIAPEVLSPGGLQEFEKRNYQFDGTEEAQVLESAEDAIAAQQEELLNQTKRNVLEDAKLSLTDETVVATDEVTDEVLQLMETKEAGIKSIKDGGDFNFDYMDSTDDINATITALSEVYKNPTNAAKRGYISNNTTIQKAAEKLQDEIGFTQSLLSRKSGQTWSAEEFVAARELLYRSTQKLVDLAEKIKSGGGSDIDRLAFRRQMAIHAGIQMQLKGAQTEAARALQSFKIQVGGEASPVRLDAEAKRMLAESGGIELVDDMAEKFLEVWDEKGLQGVNEMARGKGWKATTRQVLSEAYLAGMLSNTSTQVRNGFGTALFMAFQLPTELIAGIYGSIGRQKNLFLYPTVQLNPDQVYVDDVIVRTKGWYDSVKDAWRVAKIGFARELPAGASKLDIEQYRSIKGSSDSHLANVIDQIGKRARLPFRALLFSDEFFKTISQRGELYVQANHVYKKAIREGKSVTEAQDEAAMLLLDPMSQADVLIEKSKYDTLQSDLGQLSKTMGMFQNFSIFGIPFGRFIMPFATAPTNDAVRAAEYIPFLNLAAPGQASAVVNVGTKEHQLFMGRMGVSLTVGGLIMGYAIEGRMTGAYPNTKAARNALPKGWQPWSFVFRGEGFPTDANGDFLPLYDETGNPNGPLRYVSYNGFGPATSVLGIYADTAQRMSMAEEQTRWYDIPYYGAASTAAYFKDVPMLEGISNIVDMFPIGDRDPNFNLTQIFKSPAGAATVVGFPNPYSSMQNAITKAYGGTASYVPREDQEYWTLDEIEAVNPDGTFVHATKTGEAQYSKVGRPKNNADDIVLNFINEMDALMSKDSWFPRNQEDKTVRRYDTLGRPMGEEDLNIFVKPGAAIVNQFSGFKYSETQRVDSPWEMELMRIATSTGGWPLRNKKVKSNIPLKPGAINDWVNLAKNPDNPNVVRVHFAGVGDMTFHQMLEITLSETGNRYARKYNEFESDYARRAYIQSIENDFFDAAWEQLIQDPKYANLRDAYYGKLEVDKMRKEGEIQ